MKVPTKHREGTYTTSILAPTSKGSRAGAVGVKGGGLREKGIKRLPDGRWQFSWCFRGRYHRRIVPTHTLAVASLAKVRAEIAEGKYLEKEVKPQTTIQQAVKEFLRWGETNLAPGTLMRDKQFSEQWCAFARFKGKPLAEITVQDIEAYRTQQLSHVGRRTCDYDLSRLRRLFVLSEEWGLSKGNPARAVKMFHADNRRDRFLTPDEEAKLLEEVPEWVRPAIIFSVNTGLRQGELVSLTWGQVDLPRKTITLTADKTKGKKMRRIPLNALALEAIGTQPRSLNPEAPVFPLVARYGADNLRQAFRRAVRSLGMDSKAICWHTLRHTFASRLVQAGVGLLTVKELLGHSTLVMVQRYAHLADENLKSAVDTLVVVPNLRKTCDAPKGGSEGEKA